MSESLTPAGGDDLVPGFEKPNKIANRLITGMHPNTRKAFLGCWGMHRHLSGMESPLALASMISVWIRDWGLAEEDAATCLRSMCAPDSMGKHKFTSDFVTELSAYVDRAIKERKKEKARREMLAPEIDPDEAAKAAAIIREIADRSKA